MQKQANKIKVVYKGRRINSKNKLLHAYFVAGNDAEVFYLKSKLGDYPIGTIIETQDFGDFFRPPHIGIGVHSDALKVTSWEIQDQLNYAQAEAEKKWNKLGNNQRYDLIIKELNAIIEQLPHAQKKAFVFKLLSDLDCKG